MNILITGANRGIGLGLVQRYLEEHDVKRIFAAVRKPAEAKAIHDLNDNRIVLIEYDVLDDKKIETAAEWLKAELKDEGLHILINNAGIALSDNVHIEDPSREAILKTFDTNLCGVVMTTTALLPLLQKAASSETPAKIINMSSGHASIELTTNTWASGRFAYGASKAAVNHYSKQLSTTKAVENIIVIALRPGHVATDMNGHDGNLKVPEATHDIVNMVSGLRIEDSGKFLDRFGKIQSY
ncbi:unnamed protein product [Bursaphelenchus okinawaensis]|uniref:Uncharacterized protein n=1 Tax=Bursaphelenchus okinawaensis TaxID=465554 RepID=A0A811LWK9_9BILA|nr:unnamed protein product [Bursaphelenchus okinawaensis]CAG9128441.1 unnamed protein product [Bursaphelenchus okinawaensis]